MARRRGETIEELFISLGLDISQLESDFLSADRALNENMARLRRQSQLINLRAQVELEGLDEAIEGARRLEVREQALNEQLAVQRDRIRLTEAALQQLHSTRNQDRAAVQRAQIALERERLTMAQLETQVQRLREAQEGERDSAERMPNVMNQAAEAIKAGIAVATGAVLGATEAVDRLLERFDEMQLKAYELHASFEDTREYLRHVKLAGAESDDLMGFIRGIDDALAKGDVDDPETMALKKYGVNLFENDGRLKEYTEQLNLLYEGYRRAKESGEEVEYLLMLNGESIHEILPLFERWEEAKSDARKIEDAGLNFTEMHEASREMALLKEQTEQFVEALTSTAMPGARSVMKTLFDVMKEGTAAIKENADAIRMWGMTAGTILGETKDVIYELESVKAPFSERGLVSDMMVNVVRQLMHQNPLSDEYGRWLQYFRQDAEMLRESNMEQYKEGLEEAEEATRELEEQTNKLGDVLSYAWRDSINRAKAFREELEDLKVDLDFEGDEYGKSRAELEKWLEREMRGLNTFTEEQQRETEELLSRDELPEEKRIELTELLANKMKMTAEEQEAIEELYAAKSEQIEQERASRLEDIREQQAAQERTELANKLMAIEKEREEWKSAGMEEAEALELAEKAKNAAILELEERFEESRAALGQTGLQQALMRIEREKEAWRQKGIDEARAIEMAEQAKADAQRNAGMNALRTQLKEMRAYREGGYGGLQEYYKEQLYQSGVRPEELQLTREQLEAFDQAREMATRSLLPNFMTDTERSKNEAFEQQWLNSYKARASKIKGYAIGDDGQMKFLTDVPAHHYPYDKDGNLNKDKAYQRGVDARLDDFYGRDRIKESLEGLNIGEELRMQLERDLSSRGLLTEQMSVQLSELNVPVEELSRQFDEIKMPVDRLNDQTANLEIPNKVPETRVLGAIEDYDDYSLPTANFTDRLLLSAEPLMTLKEEIEKLNATFDAFAVKIASFAEFNVDDAIQTLMSRLEALSSPLDGAAEKLAAFFAPIDALALKINDLASRLSEPEMPRNAPSNAQKIAPSTVPATNSFTVQVTINEAHAWDSSHIEELTERVADVLTPVLVNAIGGDGNAY